jgi:hypothetical protein
MFRVRDIRRPANDDMVEGYMDGRDLDAPEPSANRSHSYRHGFAVGRAEKVGKTLGTFDQVNRMADAAMDADMTICC